MNRAILSLLSVLVLSNLASVFGQSSPKSLDDAEKDWRAAIKPNADDCRHLMSDETASYFDDDEEYDNEEVRKFLACLYTSLEYMVDGKMVADPIHKDIDKHFDGTGQSVIDSLHDAVDFCVAHEVEDSDSDVDTAGKFTNCLNKKKKNDVEK